MSVGGVSGDLGEEKREEEEEELEKKVATLLLITPLTRKARSSAAVVSLGISGPTSLFMESTIIDGSENSTLDCLFSLALASNSFEVAV